MSLCVARKPIITSEQAHLTCAIDTGRCSENNDALRENVVPVTLHLGTPSTVFGQYNWQSCSWSFHAPRETKKRQSTSKRHLKVLYAVSLSALYPGCQVMLPPLISRDCLSSSAHMHGICSSPLYMPAAVYHRSLYLPSLDTHLPWAICTHVMPDNRDSCSCYASSLHASRSGRGSKWPLIASPAWQSSPEYDSPFASYVTASWPKLS